MFQSSLLKLHRTRASYREEYPFLQWWFVIARSEWLDRVKRPAARDERLEREPAADEGASDRDTPESLLARARGELDPEWSERLAALPPESAEVLRRRVLDEESFDAIARATGRTPAGVRKILSRALLRLRGGEA